MSLNKAMLIGRLGKDPELTYTNTGTAKCKFSMATSEKYKDQQGQQQERTQWHNIVVWGKLAEICGKYLAKGRQAYVEGRIENRSWDDRAGNKRYITEVVAKEVTFLGDRGDAQRGPAPHQNHGGDNQQRNFGYQSERRSYGGNEAPQPNPQQGNTKPGDWQPAPDEDPIPF